MEIKKVLESKDKKFVIIPRHSNIKKNDYVKIIKIKEEGENS